jgi:choline-sulfatase
VRGMREHAGDERPWVLFVSFVCPHPPYIAPPRLFELYPPEQIPLPPQSHPAEYPAHPALARMREQFGYGDFDHETLRRAIAAYLGACTYLDERVGEVLEGMREAGLAGKTRILYTSDHGENLGARGLWGKFTMYEESAGVPLILSGPGVAAGSVVESPVSLVDCFPTVLQCVGAEPHPDDRDLPGASLWNASAGQRCVLSEYHAVSSRNGVFMLRDGRYKYVHYVHEPPQLFDLDADPHELRDLANEASHQGVVARCETQLRAMVDPEGVDGCARADQERRITQFGGREAVISRGTFDNSPVPGETAAFKGV